MQCACLCSCAFAQTEEGKRILDRQTQNGDRVSKLRQTAWPTPFERPTLLPPISIVASTKRLQTYALIEPKSLLGGWNSKVEDVEIVRCDGDCAEGSDALSVRRMFQKFYGVDLDVSATISWDRRVAMFGDLNFSFDKTVDFERFHFQLVAHLSAQVDSPVELSLRDNDSSHPTRRKVTFTVILPFFLDESIKRALLAAILIETSRFLVQHFGRTSTMVVAFEEQSSLQKFQFDHLNPDRPQLYPIVCGTPKDRFHKLNPFAGTLLPILRQRVASSKSEIESQLFGSQRPLCGLPTRTLKSLALDKVFAHFSKEELLSQSDVLQEVVVEPALPHTPELALLPILVYCSLEPPKTNKRRRLVQ